MAHLAKLVHVRGGTPETAEEYQAEFQRRLGEELRRRPDRVRREPPGTDSLLVCGVRELLETLCARGITVTLATGSAVHEVRHEAELLDVARAFRLGIPATVHPGIGYDIVSCHPLFNGAAIGRAAATDFHSICASVDQLDGGVLLAVGSAVMAPQVFEKSLSCVHNVRFQNDRPTVSGHSIFVVDLQDGGNWDWSQGEPPKTSAAYHLRFCKSFSRMGGAMQYSQCDNLAFVHNLLHELRV